MARVIKADEMGSLGAVKAGLLNLRDFAEQARQIVLDARKESVVILAQARSQAIEIKEQAARDGQAEGLAQGRADGLAQGVAQAQADAQARLRSQTDELADLAGGIVRELTAVREQTIRRMRREVLDFSLQLAAKIVGQVAVTDIGAARGNLEKAMQLCCRGGEIVVKVNPRQLRRLEEHCRELTETLSVQGTVRLMADETIAPGGVKLISGDGEIDATIETQLANLAQGLVGGMGGLFESSPDGRCSGGVYEKNVFPASAGQAAYGT